VRIPLLKPLALAVPIVTISALHYATSPSQLVWHEVYQHLYYVPVIVGAYWYGVPGGLATAIATSVAYLPHIRTFESSKTSSSARSCWIRTASLLSTTFQTGCARAHRVADLRMELPDEGISLENVERELLLAALEKHNWNQTRAGAFLNITHSTLLYRMQKFGLERDRKAAESPASE
jgi:hypothetical protein